MAQEMAEDDVPGVAVAVLEGGEFTYTRGFGHADIADDVWLDSGHVLRWASISKAAGGALTMRLHEQGALQRDDPVRDHATGLAVQHSATFEQLAANRGCVRHYANNESSTLEDVDAVQWEKEKTTDSQLAQTWYPDAATAVEEFDDDPLRSYDSGTDTVSTTCVPGASSLYSTHGYTVLGAGLEAATGRTVEQLVREEISEPLGLDTLRQEQITDTSVRRATLYTGADNDAADPDETTWKTLGGGVESDIRDLARFGRAVVQGQVYADTEYVWNGGANGWSYAYGWGTYTQDGHRAAAKNGGQLGSDTHLIVYPDDDVVVAVMINRAELTDPADHATDIAEYIGELIL
ncbi:serine hydrolase [Asanoa sp. WMMD1127]|nr:serine hydrolase domain-containing protein [Asanoa sp. WMMD1127]MDG4824950.1 serine hydrolase [Asanoa sp. WMMD1127]